MKKLKIAQIAPLWFDVPPKDYGGTERVVSYLTDGLVAKGHDVTLFASPDSQTKAKLISPISSKLLKTIESYLDPSFQATNLYLNAEVFKRASEFDIIHSHAYYFSFPFSEFVKTPVIHTLHNQLPRGREAENEIMKRYRHLNFVSISDEFRTHFDLNYIATVHHGLDLSYFPFYETPGKDYLFWMGRAAKDKGELAAIQVAEKTGKELILAMSLRKSSADYFKSEIEPRLKGQISLRENVRFEETEKYYGDAKAFIFPVEWREPFGLILIESMACGTPVIAYSRGSIPEIIKDGATGFVVNPSEEEKHGNFIIKKVGMDGLIEAVNRIYSMPDKEYAQMRKNCRKLVEERFTTEKMTERYEKVYNQLIV